MDLDEFRKECREYFQDNDKTEEDDKKKFVFIPLHEMLGLRDLPKQSVKSLEAEYKIIQRLKKIEREKDNHTHVEDEYEDEDELLSLEESERQLIKKYIDKLRPETTWKEIADQLGIGKKTLWKRRKKYGLD